MKELLKHALLRLTRKSALDIERKKKKPSQYNLSLYVFNIALYSVETDHYQFSYKVIASVVSIQM